MNIPLETYSQLPNKFAKKNKNGIIPSIIKAISEIIDDIGNMIRSIKSNAFVSTADGSNKYGVRTIIPITGITIRLIEDSWSSQSISISWDPQRNAIQLGDYPEVIVSEKSVLVNLTNDESLRFIVLIEHDKLPLNAETKLLEFTDKLTVDYLDLLAKNRGFRRWKNEMNEHYRVRVKNPGMANSYWKLKKQLKWLLGYDVTIRQRIERWETQFTPGLSFLGYGGKSISIPDYIIPEPNFGSHFFQNHNNIKTYEILIPASVDLETEKTIKEIAQEYSLSGIAIVIMREIA